MLETGLLKYLESGILKKLIFVGLYKHTEIIFKNTKGVPENDFPQVRASCSLLCVLKTSQVLVY